jgi:hypothetical protein
MGNLLSSPRAGWPLRHSKQPDVPRPLAERVLAYGCSHWLQRSCLRRRRRMPGLPCCSWASWSRDANLCMRMLLDAHAAEDVCFLAVIATLSMAAPADVQSGGGYDRTGIRRLTAIESPRFSARESATWAETATEYNVTQCVARSSPSIQANARGSAGVRLGECPRQARVPARSAPRGNCRWYLLCASQTCRDRPPGQRPLR